WDGGADRRRAWRRTSPPPPRQGPRPRDRSGSTSSPRDPQATGVGPKPDTTPAQFRRYKRREHHGTAWRRESAVMCDRSRRAMVPPARIDPDQDVAATTERHPAEVLPVTTPATTARSMRSPDRPRTAFVLSGGGNQAVSQVGMLRALLERDIFPDVVIGTSAGALNGAVVATDPTVPGVEHLADVWMSIRSGEVFQGGRLARAWNVLRRDDHLFTNEGLRSILDRAHTAETFAETEVA